MPARSTLSVRRFSTWAGPAWLGICCALVAVLAAGCASWQGPRLDPTGERILTPAGSPVPPFPPGASPLAPPVGPSTGVSLSPSALIAPIGSEVVMVASVVGGEGFLLTNEIVEWTIDPTGVGQFLSPGERRPLDLLNWWRGIPLKIDARYAVNSTLRYPLTLDRGTPTPYDDIFVQTGQAWVSVISPIAGTSKVTAFVPAISGWDLRQQTATIYWIDAQWQFPAPAISPAGSRNTLVTTLTRQSDNAPLAGWLVRYEITGGPEAGFAPDGSASVQVAVNESGQAAAEIFQRQAAAGTNQVGISVIQPAALDGQSQQLTVGAGSTLQTWSGAGGPSPTLAPQPTPSPSPPATLEPTPSAEAALHVTIDGPTSASVGDDVQFQIRVNNRGTSPATGLVVRDRFDAGLQHAAAVDSIERDLIDLQPGGIAQLTVNFRVAQAGQLCQDVEITGNVGLRATARHCLAATSPPIQEPAPGEQRWEPQPPGAQPLPGDAPGVQPLPGEPPVTQPIPARPPTEQPGSAQPRAAQAVTLSVRKTGADRRMVGETVLFTIEMTNRGDKPLDDLVISNNFETTLEAVAATEGKEWLVGGALGWRIGTLAAAGTIRRDVQVKCLSETPRACVRVTVTARDMQPVAEEACLEIVGQQAGNAAPAAGGRQPIGVSVAETADPIHVGGKTTYQILVENNDAQSYFDVVVSATLSEEMKLDTIASPVGTQGQVLPGSVRFEPIRELRSGEAPLNFELHATGARAGAATVKVEVSHRGQTAPIKAEQMTQVLP